jgi:hypothetical protein
VIETLNTIVRDAVQRLYQQTTTDLPPLIAAVTIFLIAYVIAALARWLIHRAFKGLELERWMRRSGISALLDRSGRMRAPHIVGRGVFWAILFAGILTALNAVGGGVTSRIVESAVMLLPRAVAGAAIVLGGVLLAQFLGRGALVWAVNEDLPYPRRLSMLVRVLVVFVAVVAAADTLDFARTVFLAAFILIVGGLALAIGIAVGLTTRDAMKNYLRERSSRAASSPYSEEEKSLWSHL